MMNHTGKPPIQGKQGMPVNSSAQGGDQLKIAIFTQLKKQGPFQGWQSQVSLGTRAAIVLQIFSANRLVREVQLGSSLNAAQLKDVMFGTLESESNIFSQSPSIELYKSKITQKLKSLQGQRAQMSSSMHLGPGQTSQQLNSQQQHAISIGRPYTGLSSNQQSHQSFIGDNQVTQGPQGPSQQINGQQGNSMPQAPSRFPLGPPQLHRPDSIMPSAASRANMMSPAEQKALNDCTVAFMRRIQGEGRLEELRNRTAAQMNPELVQHLLKSGVDLAQHRCREEALKELQRRAQSQGRTFPAQSNPPGIAQHQSVPSEIQTHSNVSADSSATIDLSQFLGQQADAQRSQDAGDLVVPASNNQPLVPQVMQPGFGSASGNNRAAASNTALMPHGPVQNRQPGTQPTPRAGSSQHVPQQLSNSSNGQAMPHRPPNAPALTGQVGGLHASQQVPAPSPMQWLNRPLVPPEDSSRTPGSIHSQPLPRQSQQTSPQPGYSQGQQHLPAQLQSLRPNQGPPGMPPKDPQSLRIPPELPEHVRHQLLSLPRDQAEALLKSFETTQNWTNEAQLQTQRKNQINSNAGPSLRQQVMAQTNKQGISREIAGSQHIPIGPQLTTMNTMQSGGLPSMPNAAQPSLRRAAHEFEFPRDILKKVLPQLDIPRGLSRWGQLRHWLTQNPAISAQIHPNILNGIHQKQLQNYMQQNGSHGQRQVAEAMGTGSTSAHMGPQQIRAPGVPIPQRLAQKAFELAKRGIIQAENGIARVHVSPQEVQIQRQQLRQSPNIPDESIRNAIMTHKLKQVNQVDTQWAQVLYHHARTLFGLSTRPANAQVSGAPSGDRGQDEHHLTSQLQPTQAVSLQTAPQSIDPVQQHTLDGRPQNSALLSQPMRPSPSANAPVQPVPNMPPHQRTQLEAQRRAAQLQHRQSVGPLLNKTAWESIPPAQREARFYQLFRQTQQANPPGQVVNMAAEELSTWTRHVLSQLSKLNLYMDKARQLYVRQGNEQVTREIVTCILRIKQQQVVSNGHTTQVRFNRTADELKQAMAKLMMFDHNFNPKPINVGSSSDHESVNSAGLSQPQVVDSRNKATSHLRPLQDATHSQSSLPANHQLLKQDDPNGGPADSVPPSAFAVGSPTPDGSVRYGPKQTFNLHLPEKKRRKLNQKSEDPNGPRLQQPKAQSMTRVSQAVGKSAAEAPKAALSATVTQAINHPFKCSIPGCESQNVGFISQDEQHEHEKSVHGYSGDSLQFCLESMRKALGDISPNGSNPWSQPTLTSAMPPPKPNKVSENRLSSSVQTAMAPQGTSGLERSSSIAMSSKSAHGNGKAQTQTSDAGFWASAKLKREDINMLFEGIEGATEVQAFGTGCIQWLSPPTPPPIDPSLSASPYETLQDFTDFLGERRSNQSSTTPGDDPWEKIDLDQESGLKRSAFEEYKDHGGN